MLIYTRLAYYLMKENSMTDTLTPELRHLNMSHIHGSDTSIEVKLRKALFARGFRFRKNVGNMTGKPD